MTEKKRTRKWTLHIEHAPVFHKEEKPWVWSLRNCYYFICSSNVPYGYGAESSARRAGLNAAKKLGITVCDIKTTK